MSLPPIDFETYSAAGFVWDELARKWRGPKGAPKGQKGLPVIGTANYAKHPSTEVLSLAYNITGEARQWLPGMSPPLDLFDYLRRGGIVEAWNAAFEWWIWGEVCTRKYGWPPLPTEQLRCAMAKSRAHGLPGKLALAADVLNLANRKDADGTRLLNKFSIPRNPTKGDARTRITLADDPADGARLLSYNVGDIAAELEASTRTPDLSPAELAHWQLDQRINRRGVAVDVASVHACCAIVEQAIEKYDAELVALTGCKSTELQKLIGWLHGQGVHTDSLDEENVERLLALTLQPHCRRALEIRAAVGSASVKKVFAMRLQMTADGRLHDLYNFHGARTGRPTGEGPQPTNLPKAGPNVHRCGWLGKLPLPGGGCGRRFGGHRIACPWCGVARGPAASKAVEWHPEAVDDALEVISWQSLELLEQFFGDAMLTVAGCLRGLFVASPGCRFVSSDYTAIEGVVIACLAGEQWRIDAYRNDAPMYLLSAERMYGITVAEMQAYAEAHGHHHPRRQDGKFGELGLGFGGWVGALRGLGAEGTDEELKAQALAWRAASPALVWLWGGQTKGAADGVREDAGHIAKGVDRWNRAPEYFGLEGMAVLAVQNPGTEYPVHRLDGGHTGISYVCRDDVLYCRVPSGGIITYHRPRLAPAAQDWRGLSLTYEGYNTNPKQGPIGWVTMSLYSGKCAENVTQKVARDIQMHGLANVEAAGYPVALHTYDEGVGDTPIGHGSVQDFEARMCDVPAWARGWPIKAAGGWEGWRYRKA